MGRLNDMTSYRLAASLDDAVNLVVRRLPNHYKNKSDFVRMAILGELKRVVGLVVKEDIKLDWKKLEEDTE